MLKDIATKINHSAIQNFIEHHQKAPVFSKQLHGGHIDVIKPKTQNGVQNLVDTLQRNGYLKKYGGSAGVGGSAGAGGSIHMGGAFDPEDVPSTPQEMYQFILHMSPYQIEMAREVAAQLLGAKHSPMFGSLVDQKEELEGDPEDYENIIRMPNAHATARMLEAEHGYAKGGGFMKAFRHVANIAGKVYKSGRGLLQLANKNKDTLLKIVPDEYRGTASGLLETAASIDQAINPMIEAAIDAVQENATQEQKDKLKKMAEQSIDNAVATHLPGAKPYYDSAKEAKEIYNKEGASGVAGYAAKKVLHSDPVQQKIKEVESQVPSALKPVINQLMY